MPKSIKKIMIFGRPGSGKSTFSFYLHKATGLPLYHLDKYFYISNWIERDNREYLKIQQSIVKKKAWIIDGNSIKSLEKRYSKADIVLYFNYPKLICLWRIIKRSFLNDNKINDCAKGCAKNISFSLIKYMWNFEKRTADQILELKIKYPNTKFLEIKSNKNLAQINKFFVSKASGF